MTLKKQDVISKITMRCSKLEK